MKAKILVGDCRAVLAGFAESSIDSIVTDPPYELGFMGKSWDKTGIANDVAMWRECLRVLKPGGHLLSFGGSRTYHRMACAIEDAGFEIRDQIMWLYGSGFPKSLDVSKAIDKAAGVERPVVGVNTNGSGANLTKLNNHDAGDTGIGYMDGSGKVFDVTAAATDAAKQWEGWGTALKPAHEPICVARKPLEGTVAANVLKYGTGALNIDGCRVEGSESTIRTSNAGTNGEGWGMGKTAHLNGSSGGRWPANVILDGSDEVVGLFPDTASGAMKAETLRAAQDEPGSVCYGTYGGNVSAVNLDANSGSAARFFYTAKADKNEREMGCYDLAVGPLAYSNQTQAEVKRGNTNHVGKSGVNTIKMRGNTHPTVKPIDLMRYLCRLVTPKGGTILDNFTGSGSTGVAALMEDFDFIGIEQRPEYAAIAEKRMKEVSPLLNEVEVIQPQQTGLSSSPSAEPSLCG